LTAEVRQNTNVARAFEEQTVRVLATVDQAMRRVRDMALANPEAPMDLVRIANETGLAPGILVQLSLVDASGRFGSSNLDPDGSRTGHVDLSEREHVRVHLAPATMPAEARLESPDSLFVGKPVLGKVSKKWTIQLSRRIAGPDGRIQGLVVASLDPTYFEEVFRRVLLGRQGSLALVGTDLVFRARVVGGKSAGMGTSLGTSSGFAREARGLEGHYTSVSTVDAVNRIVAYRRIADYPLYLLVTTAQDEALEGWDTLRDITSVLTALLTLAVIAGAAYFVVSLRRMEAAHVALRRSEAQANAANQAKSEFLAAVSHELRTPLTSIRGFAELMEHRLEQPKFRETAGLIRKGAEHLNELLTQILDLAKVEAGAMPLNLEPVELRPLVQGTADFFALAADAKGLALKLEVGDDVPETLVCDSLRLKQVLNNLLSNAVKFTEKGAVTLAVAKRDGRIEFQVIDTGPGIPLELHDTIFEKFRQANDRVSYQHGGTGLGLALSRGLAELMNGRLSLDSNPGSGARFTLSLPTA
jgi:signal transduction histidine kinase